MLIDIKEEVHEVRMKTECQDYFEIDKEDFKLVLGRFKKKETKSYDLFTMASESFQNSVFKLTNRMVEEEDFPKRCDEKKKETIVEKQRFDRRFEQPQKYPHEVLAPKVMQRSHCRQNEE